MTKPIYKKGKGPINIKVVDPLNLVSGYFECKFLYSSADIAKPGQNFTNKGADTAEWVIYRYDKEGGSFLYSVH